MKEQFTTKLPFICINTTDYENFDDAMVQSFSLDNADNLGFCKEYAEQFKQLKVGELLKVDDVYEGVYVMRVCKD